jgi:hypothetical protein
VQPTLIPQYLPIPASSEAAPLPAPVPTCKSIRLLFLGCSDSSATSSDTGDASSFCVVRPELTEGRSAASNACSPLAGAIVDVWHCDALGVYSDVSDPSFNTSGKKFLRGYQVTGSDGVARFTTIYPGWYQGRAVHIHFKIRSAASAASAYEFTSQLFFDDSLTDQVHATEPYASKGQRTLRNSGDGIYTSGGSQLVLDVTGTADGYAATFNIALDTV